MPALNRTQRYFLRLSTPYFSLALKSGEQRLTHAFFVAFTRRFLEIFKIEDELATLFCEHSIPDYLVIYQKLGVGKGNHLRLRYGWQAFLELDRATFGIEIIRLSQQWTGATNFNLFPILEYALSPDTTYPGRVKLPPIPPPIPLSLPAPTTNTATEEQGEHGPAPHPPSSGGTTRAKNRIHKVEAVPRNAKSIKRVPRAPRVDETLPFMYITDEEL